MGSGLMTSSMRLAVGLVAAIVAGAWLGLAYAWFVWSDEPEFNQPAWSAARGALWFAVAFGICEVTRRLLRRGWFFLVPVAALAGSALYDLTTLAWSGGGAWPVARIIAYWLVSVPVMAAVVVLAHAVTKERPSGADVRSG